MHPTAEASDASVARPTDQADGALALTVRGGRLLRGGAPFFVSGMNHWAATTLARDGCPRGWDQVRRDLDELQRAGVNTIRTMAATEGPDTEPWRIVPAMQPSRGRCAADVMAGVPRLADELGRRRMVGIFTLNNFWPWSGGMAQYLAWSGAGPIPYPPPAPGGRWDDYQRYASRFYECEPARRAFADWVRVVVPPAAGNPAVVWEIANEARGMTRAAAYRGFIDDTARLVKSLAPAQLVTTGSEGLTPAPGEAGLDVLADHASEAVDFATFHVWAQNWGWVRPDALEDDYPSAFDRARAYVTEHVRLATKLGKPILLEEFGFPRDGASCDPRASTTLRDRYFEQTYALVASLLPTTPLAGIAPWAWAGDVGPRRPGGHWRPGDPFIGDPPHEPQGWYSLYARDTTMDVVRRWSPCITAGGR